ncbi:hypothetical protein OKHIF_07090 [Mycobacteroides chelonae]
MIDEVLLPGLEGDLATVLAAGAMLRKETGPVFGVVRDLHTPLGALNDRGLLSRHQGVDGDSAPLDDERILLVQGDPETPAPSVQ